jgi:Fic family protein
MAQITHHIITQLLNQLPKSSKELFEESGLGISYATYKRYLTKLVKERTLHTSGTGKATKYLLSPTYEITRPIDLEDYFRKEIDERVIKDGFQFELISEVLDDLHLFSEKELIYLGELHERFKANVSKLSKIAFQKEMERLAIDLSWKSSQIEGNTYSLLETEVLLRENEEAKGKTAMEARMLLNHKEAIDFIVQEPSYLEPLTVSKIEDIHSLLMKDLEVARNLRRYRVGISGTNYKPLENEFQIKEALELTCQLINSKVNVLEKAPLALLMISYIQPFEDGNKRTGRIIANAILLAHGYCPLSFRTVDPLAYKKAMLVFYEINNITPFKEIFINQFEFAVNTYF